MGGTVRQRCAATIGHLRVRSRDVTMHFITYRARVHRAALALPPIHNKLCSVWRVRKTCTSITTSRRYTFAKLSSRHTQKNALIYTYTANSRRLNSAATTSATAHTSTKPPKHQTSLTLPNRSALEQTTSPFPSPTARPGSMMYRSAVHAGQTAPPLFALLPRCQRRRHRWSYSAARTPTP